MDKINVFGGLAVGFVIGAMFVAILNNNELAMVGALLAIACAILSHHK